MTNKEPQRQLHYPTVFPVGGFLVQKGNYLTCLNGHSTNAALFTPATKDKINCPGSYT